MDYGEEQGDQGEVSMVTRREKQGDWGNSVGKMNGEIGQREEGSARGGYINGV